ncbi:MAG: adenosylcobinamide-GDP ribazoletransferase [Lachnospiraceae bacterium]|nr:adenosylcobinamide-GDP ribazoletransferase [Lachnospiraceae bacterium]
MNYIYGLIMAWGMFTAIPYPFAGKWKEEARDHMLVMFPVIGLVTGGMWIAIAFLTESVPGTVRAVIMAAIPWLLTGFIHLDGYMDVCDAILSRRDLETKQKILKDSRCGAMAVISSILLIAMQIAVCVSLDEYPLTLIVMPVAVRAAASICVLNLKPMNSSEYEGVKPQKIHNIILSGALTATVVLPPIIMAVSDGYVNTACFAPIVAAFVYTVFALLAKKSLGGMSGDISGFALVLGELAGLVMML